MASNQTGWPHAEAPDSPHVRPADIGIYAPSFREMNTIDIYDRTLPGQQYKTFSLINQDKGGYVTGEKNFIANYSPNSHHGMTLQIKKDHYSSAIAHINISGRKTVDVPCANVFDDSMTQLGVVEHRRHRLFEVFTKMDIFKDLNLPGKPRPTHDESGAHRYEEFGNLLPKKEHKRIDPIFTLELPHLHSSSKKNKYPVKGLDFKNQLVDVATIEVNTHLRAADPMTPDSRPVERVILSILSPLEPKYRALLLGLAFMLSAELGVFGMSLDDVLRHDVSKLEQPEVAGSPSGGAHAFPVSPPQNIPICTGGDRQGHVSGSEGSYLSAASNLSGQYYSAEENQEELFPESN